MLSIEEQLDIIVSEARDVSWNGYSLLPGEKPVIPMRMFERDDATTSNATDLTLEV